MCNEICNSKYYCPALSCIVFILKCILSASVIVSEFYFFAGNDVHKSDEMEHNCK